MTCKTCNATGKIQFGAGGWTRCGCNAPSSPPAQGEAPAAPSPGAPPATTTPQPPSAPTPDRPLPRTVDGIARRCRIDLATPVEQALRAALAAYEGKGTRP